jgi:hypothetical protein
LGFGEQEVDPCEFALRLFAGRGAHAHKIKKGMSKLLLMERAMGRRPRKRKSFKKNR